MRSIIFPAKMTIVLGVVSTVIPTVILGASDESIKDFDTFIAESLLIDGDVNYFSAATQIGQPHFEADENGLSVKGATGISLGSIALSTTGLLVQERQRVMGGFYSGVRLIEGIRDIDIAVFERRYGVIFYSHTPPFISGSLDELKHWHDLGLRILQVNDISDPIPGGALTSNEGLTQHGRRVVQECIDLGIVLDVSHAEELVTLQVAEIAQARAVPIIANHAPAYALRYNGDDRYDRGKTDAELLAIAASGGVVGVMAFGPWIRLGDAPATVLDYVAHLNYIVNLVGIDHLGLASDARIDGEWNPDSDGNPRVSGDGLIDSPMRWKWVLRSLHLDYGYSREDLRKIMGLNFYRVYRQVWSRDTYENWKTENFPSPDLSDSSPQQDPDGDSIPNLMECASGSDPLSLGAAFLSPFVLSRDMDHWVVRFRRNPNLGDIRYVFESSVDLTDWVETYNSDHPPPGLELNSHGEFMEIESSIESPVFFRLKVVEKDEGE